MTGKFKIGDHVRVVSGNYSGKDGHVTEGPRETKGVPEYDVNLNTTLGNSRAHQTETFNEFELSPYPTQNQFGM